MILIVGHWRVRVMMGVKQGDSGPLEGWGHDGSKTVILILVGHWRVRVMMRIKQGGTNSGPLEG